MRPFSRSIFCFTARNSRSVASAMTVLVFFPLDFAATKGISQYSILAGRIPAIERSPAPAGIHQTSKNIIMSDTYVPLISSGVAGPLGVVHLPRLWQKVSLEENGKLAAGYPGVGKGFDAMTLAALGLEEQAVRNYIKQNKPTYPEFEAWVNKNAKSLNRDAIEKHNAAVRGYNHDDETRKGILGACKIADDASSPKDAVNLNNLDDWYEFHQAVLQ